LEAGEAVGAGVGAWLLGVEGVNLEKVEGTVEGSVGWEKECKGAKAGAGSMRTLEVPREDSAVKLCESGVYITGGPRLRFMDECR
jgi:hypothetical protein